MVLLVTRLKFESAWLIHWSSLIFTCWRGCHWIPRWMKMPSCSATLLNLKNKDGLNWFQLNLLFLLWVFFFKLGLKPTPITSSKPLLQDFWRSVAGMKHAVRGFSAWTNKMLLLPRCHFPWHFNPSCDWSRERERPSALLS